MTVVGGLRDRLLLDNIYYLLNDSLDALGWFDSGRAHLPVTLTVDPVGDDTELLPNIVAITMEDVDPDDLEMGSNLREYEWEGFIDVYAEDTPIGKHLAGDIRAILEGKLPSIGRVGGTVPIVNYSLATPVQVFSVDIIDVNQGRQRMYTKPFQRYWWTIGFFLVDAYGDEDDD